MAYCNSQENLGRKFHPIYTTNNQGQLVTALFFSHFSQKKTEVTSRFSPIMNEDVSPNLTDIFIQVHNVIKSCHICHNVM